MKTTFKSFASALLAVAIVGTTATVRAADEAKLEKQAEKKAKTETPAAEGAAKAVKGLPYSGTLTAVDKAGMTVTLKKKEAEKTFTITSATKITNNKTGKPATLEDGVIGEPASVYYQSDSGEKPEAKSLKFGKKPAAEGEKKAEGEKPAKKEKKAEGEKAK